MHRCGPPLDDPASRVRHWTTGNDPKKPVYRIPVSKARRIAYLLGVVDPADSRLANFVSVGPDGTAVSDGEPTARGADWSDDEGQFSITPAVAPEERRNLSSRVRHQRRSIIESTHPYSLAG